MLYENRVIAPEQRFPSVLSDNNNNNDNDDGRESRSPLIVVSIKPRCTHQSVNGNDADLVLRADFEFSNRDGAGILYR